MQHIVTLRTNRYYVKMVDSIISIMVMIMLCLFRATHALEMLYGVHFARFNSASNRGVCLGLIGVVAYIFAGSFYMNRFTVFACSVLFNQFRIICSIFTGAHSIALFSFFCFAIFLLILFLISTSLWSLAVRLYTDFAVKAVSIFASFALIKLRKKLKFLTAGACLTSLNNHVSFLNESQYSLTAFGYITNQTLDQGEFS